MVPAIGEQREHLDRTILGGRRGVLTGIEPTGGSNRPARKSAALRAEYPTSSSVTVAIRTSPRSIRPAHSSTSPLPPRRTSADLSINHPGSTTGEVTTTLDA